MVRVAVVVSPGARGNAVVGRHGDGWKLRVAAPAERGRANEAVLDLFAEALGVPRDAVRLTTGGRARRKVVEVSGVAAPEVDRRLAEASGA